MNEHYREGLISFIKFSLGECKLDVCSCKHLTDKRCRVQPDVCQDIFWCLNMVSELELSAAGKEEKKIRTIPMQSRFRQSVDDCISWISEFPLNSGQRRQVQLQAE